MDKNRNAGTRHEPKGAPKTLGAKASDSPAKKAAGPAGADKDKLKKAAGKAHEHHDKR